MTHVPVMTKETHYKEINIQSININKYVLKGKIRVNNRKKRNNVEIKNVFKSIEIDKHKFLINNKVNILCYLFI